MFTCESAEFLQNKCQNERIQINVKMKEYRYKCQNERIQINDKMKEYR